MKESSFRLQDKSVLLYGGFNGLTQALIREFTVQGADVGFLNTQKPQTARFLENVNDAREIHPDYGRSAQIDVTVADKKTAFEAVSRMAELFGRIDIVIDTRMGSLNKDDADVSASRLLFEEIAPFFKSKKRGRMVFVRESETADPLLPQGLTDRLKEDFFPWLNELSEQWIAPAYGINSVTIGLTEDLVLSKFPSSPSIRNSLETLQKEFPRLQMIDANEVAAAVLFLASSLAGGINGQTLRVTR